VERAVDIDTIRTMARHMRLNIVDMISKAGSGHPGGSLSPADIVAALYFGVMNHDPQRPQ
jgi:transketolase